MSNKSQRIIDPLKSPTLKNWGDLPEKKMFKKLKNNSYVECGWGRLIFAHTFKDNEKVANLLRTEEEGKRDIAFYVRDPQVIVSQSPHEFFLDPSHAYRFWLDKLPEMPEQKNFHIRPANLDSDIESMNRIYSANDMRTIDVDSVDKDRHKIRFYVAVDSDSKEIIGNVMAADHVEIFNDSEKGSSLWALCVDPQARYPGVGRALTIYILQLFSEKGRKYLDISVMYDHPEAIQLYEQLGFQLVPVFCLKKKNIFNQDLYSSPCHDYH